MVNFFEMQGDLRGHGDRGFKVYFEHRYCEDFSSGANSSMAERAEGKNQGFNVVDICSVMPPTLEPTLEPL